MIDERQVALARMTFPEAAEALAGAEVVLIHRRARRQPGRARRAYDEAKVSDGRTRSLPLLLHHRG